MLKPTNFFAAQANATGKATADAVRTGVLPELANYSRQLEKMVALRATTANVEALNVVNKAMARMNTIIEQPNNSPLLTKGAFSSLGLAAKETVAELAEPTTAANKI